MTREAIESLPKAAQVHVLGKDIESCSRSDVVRKVISCNRVSERWYEIVQQMGYLGVFVCKWSSRFKIVKESDVEFRRVLEYWVSQPLAMMELVKEHWPGVPEEIFKIGTLPP